MKLVHLSDTHPGYRGQGIEKMVDDPWRPGVPIRQREADLMLGLIRAVDRILEQPHPDVVLRVSAKASCAEGAPFRMKKNSMDDAATL